MADEPHQSLSVSMEPSSGFTIYETRQDEILFHRVSDDELTRLTGMAPKDYWSEALWAMVGIAVGVAPTSIQSLFDAYLFTPPEPITVLELVHVVFLFAAICVGFVVSRAMKRRPDHSNLSQEIKDRTKHRLMPSG